MGSDMSAVAGNNNAMVSTSAKGSKLLPDTNGVKLKASLHSNNNQGSMVQPAKKGKKCNC